MTFSETFLVFLVILVVFLGVKFGFRKSCLCKRNDKYEVCPTLASVRTVSPAMITELGFTPLQLFAHVRLFPAESWEIYQTW